MNHCDKFPEIAAAIRLLLQAHLFCTDAGRDKWDFAVEISNLRRAGLDETHFRWLVCKGLVEHSDEITLLGHSVRSFRPIGELNFTDATCFVLTRGGVEFATKLLDGKQEDDRAHEEFDRNDAAEGQEFTKPCWNADRHELSFDGHLVKRFKHKSPNQEAILATFQEEGWPPSVTDPLPQNGDTDPKRRLNDTIKCLNHHQQNRLIRFRGNGSGEGVIWEAVFSNERV